MATNNTISPITMGLRIVRHNRVGYQVYRNYYGGHHRLAFASEKFRNAFGRLFCEFRDNLCKAPVDAVADRLCMLPFTIDVGDKSLQENTKEIWKRNRMARRAKELHTESLKMGDAYAIVWPDAVTGKAKITPQKSEQIAVIYDDEDNDVIQAAIKVWRMDKRIRVNVYLSDVITKWITVSETRVIPNSANAFVPYNGDEGGAEVSNPYGVVPVFHFMNNAPVGCCGESELHDVIPIQDALNKAVIDMLVSMEFNAFPQRWAVGLELETDDATGKPKIPFQPGVDRIWTVEDPDVKFGEFSAAQLKQFLDVQSELRTEIARVSATPLHYIAMGQNPPSGEALQAMEERFIKKILDRQESFGETWESIINFCLLIEGSQEVKVTTNWGDPAPHSALQQSQTLINKQTIGVSRGQLLRELGYTEQQITQIEAERTKEADQDAERQFKQQQRVAGLNPGSGNGDGTSDPRGGRNGSNRNPRESAGNKNTTAGN